MATVLRNGANILIRLREKMEVHLCTVFHSTRNTITLKRYASTLRMLQEPARNPSETHAVWQTKSRARVNSADLHKLYSEHIFRKPIRKTHTRRNVEKRKRLNFCGMKDEMTTNKLEYYVPESVRMLRILHLMFVQTNSPDRMSILAQGPSAAPQKSG